MGTDVLSIGIRHKLRVKKPLHLIEDISNLFNANVHVVYNNYRRDDYRVSLLNYKKDSATENLVVEIPKCIYLQLRTSPKKPVVDVDLNSEVLTNHIWKRMCKGIGHYNITGFKDNEKYKIRVFRETVELCIDIPYRWYGFIEHFNSPKECLYPGLDEYRMELKKYADITGCDYVMYIADQCQGELIYDQIYKPVDELLYYINSRMFYGVIDESIKLAKKEGRHQFSTYDEDWAIDAEQRSITIDVSDFILNNRDPISDDSIIDVLFDDFRDLKHETTN